jgi:hypothetical protein
VGTAETSGLSRGMNQGGCMGPGVACQQALTERQEVGPPSMGEEAVEPNADESTRQNVEQETP